jgi:hypothetical protein
MKLLKENGMKKRFPAWTLGLIGIIIVILLPIFYFLPRAQAATDPATHLPQKPVHVDHKDIVKGGFKTGQAVTKACLECHADAATELMKTTHWTWESKAFNVPWRDTPVTIGKINQINNFCIGSQGNENKCMSCHAGYGWEKGKESALASQENVDCLACHADTGIYGKGTFGNRSARRRVKTAANVTSMAAAETALNMAIWTRVYISRRKIKTSTWAATSTCNAQTVTGQTSTKSLGA